MTLNASLSDRPTLARTGLDFSRFGYFTRSADDSDGKDWHQLDGWLRQFKAGDFSAAARLTDALRASSDWHFRTTAAQVLADVGSVACFKVLRADIDGLALSARSRIDVVTRETVLGHCRAFRRWGRLDVLPVLMDCYLGLRLKNTPEISILPIWMEEMLTSDEDSLIGLDPPEENLEDYFSLVMTEYEALVERLGSDKVQVFRGRPLSVQDLAQAMRHLPPRFVASELVELRSHFEPATGIDCSPIFAGAQASALEAAAVAETFLESGAAGGFSPGERYFFGHRVPD